VAKPSAGRAWPYKRTLCPACKTGPQGWETEEAGRLPGVTGQAAGACWCRLLRNCNLSDATVRRWHAWADAQLRDPNTPPEVIARIKILRLRLNASERRDHIDRRALRSRPRKSDGAA
jgi:hypothetical protein